MLSILSRLFLSFHSRHMPLLINDLYCSLCSCSILQDSNYTHQGCLHRVPVVCIGISVSVLSLSLTLSTASGGRESRVGARLWSGAGPCLRYHRGEESASGGVVAAGWLWCSPLHGAHEEPMGYSRLERALESGVRGLLLYCS